MEKITTLPKELIQYLEDDFHTLDLTSYLPKNEPVDRPLPVVLTVPQHMDEKSDITLLLSQESSFQNAQTFKLPKGQRSIEIYHLYNGKIYHYRFIEEGEKGVNTYDSSFIILPKAPRLIYADGVCNVRDAGGWQTEDGRRLKQGLVYRGSELNLVANHGLDLTEEGRKTLRDELKIRTDLDLRRDDELGGITQSPIGENVTYVHESILGYVSIFKEECKAPLQRIFKSFTRPETYPIYIHCWGGADRTGTLVALLQAAMGVGYESVTRDYEITTFSRFGVRGRCSNEFIYDNIFKHLEENYPAPTLRERVRKYLKQDLDLTDEDLKAMEAILLEDDEIEPNI